jgi:hypothetical protein
MRYHPLVAEVTACLVGAPSLSSCRQHSPLACSPPISARHTPQARTEILTMPALWRSVELSTDNRLADRRSYVIGDRFYEVGAEDGSYPAEGFHTRGEMGGFWSMPIKLLDGVWFGVNGSWLKADRYTSGWGYARMDLGSASGVQISRTDFAPDGLRAGLIGLTFSSSQRRTIQLTMDAHSELMNSYPWGETKPTNQLDYNLADTGSYANGRLVFREQGTPNAANASAHDWAAVVGASLSPRAHQLGPDFRGPQDPATICPASNSPDAQPARCDDTAYGKGTGGQLSYRVQVPAGSRTVWFAVSGSDNGLDDALAMQRRALDDPAECASTLTTTVRSNDLAAALSVGAVLPTGTHAGSVRLNGSDATYRTVTTARGTEIVVDVPAGMHNANLQVSYS